MKQTTRRQLLKAGLAISGDSLMSGLTAQSASSLESASGKPSPPAVTVRIIKQATVTKAGGFYTPNRAPLQPTLFQKLPIGSIVPLGWLRHQLELDAQGLSGRLPEVSRFLKFEDTGWVHPEKSGWEEVSYWLRGYGNLGYALGDKKILAETRRWIEAVMATQEADGYFGPRQLKPVPGGKNFPDPWGHMPMLDALHSYYDYSGDKRVLDCLTRYFRWLDTQPTDYYRTGWGSYRWADTINVLQWIYNKSGEPWLLNLSRKIHENSPSYTDSERLPSKHNVNLAQGIREPAEYWLQTKDPSLLQATEANYQKIMGEYGQFPGGGFAGDENYRPGFTDPRQGFETCGIVEYMHTFEMMTRISGSPVWADRCEELAFNLLPAALTPDHRGIHYITCTNSPGLINKGINGQFDNRFTMLAYRDGAHDYRCCPHNYGMGWPYYSEELWLGTADNGLAASLYAASEVTAKVGDGTKVTWKQETEYPFSDTILLTVTTAKSVRFPLYLRVPRWCQRPEIQINGARVAPASKAGPLSFVVLDRVWKSGDVVTLRLPMTTSVKTWEKSQNSVSVGYGPLAFSLRIPEKWQTVGGTADFPEQEVLPGGPWNYGLALEEKDPTRSLRVVRKPGALAANPFTPATVPIEIRTTARRIPGWQTDFEGIITPLQPSPARTAEPVETVVLIPMGAARLRIASFPTVSTGGEATVWVPPVEPPLMTASFQNAQDFAASVILPGAEPKASGDDSIPRFTWWDHQGTQEWIQLEQKLPATVSAVSVYWFDDTGKGRCRVPKSWRLVYKASDGTWKPVTATSEYGTARDTYNRVTFAPVTTSALRIEVQLQDEMSGGLLRWKRETAA
ncbi:MAG: glycoside hydrolase family 127 protein [Cytophagales bacterium]|nr:glycoside hydrolase family 127 protein [Armatimonadota bacterium]